MDKIVNISDQQSGDTITEEGIDLSQVLQLQKLLSFALRATLLSNPAHPRGRFAHQAPSFG